MATQFSGCKVDKRYRSALSSQRIRYAREQRARKGQFKVKRTEINNELPKQSREASLGPREIGPREPALQEIDLQEEVDRQETDPREEVRRRAYQIYEERGGLNGSALQD